MGKRIKYTAVSAVIILAGLLLYRFYVIISDKIQ